MTAYEIAHNEYREAFDKFNAIRKAYRAMEICDDEYLAGREKFNKALKAFDDAEREVIEAEG